MKSVSESLNEIVKDWQLMCAMEGQESGLSTNRPWQVVSGIHVKRDAPAHTPLEGRPPETPKSRTEATLEAVALVLKQRRMEAEGQPADEAAMRRKMVLRERDASPVMLAFLYGFSSDKSVRELQNRHAKNEHTGYPLRDDERPIISDRKRARQ